jgi:tol-pal system protein YbgF
VSIDEMNALKMSVQNLQLKSDALRKEITDLKTRLDALAQDFNTIGAIKENQSSVLTKTYDFSKELQALKGMVEENRYQNDKALKDLAAERDLMNAKISALENELFKSGTKPAGSRDKAPSSAVAAAATAGALAEKVPPAEEAPKDAAEKAAANPQTLYDEAQADMKAKKYADAREKLEQLLKTYPKHKLAVSARYWLGETYFGEKKYGDAIVEFEEVWQKNPKHDKARIAMLKEGYAFYETKDCRAARVILEKLIEKYPQSEEAKLGEKKLSDIAADKTCTPKTTKQTKQKKTAKKKKKTNS